MTALEITLLITTSVFGAYAFWRNQVCIAALTQSTADLATANHWHDLAMELETQLVCAYEELDIYREEEAGRDGCK